jgi:hypothetical protein
MKVSSVLFTFPWYLFKRFWYRVYQKHILRNFSPIALLWVSGIPLFVWGFLFGAFTWTKSILLNQVATTGTVMISVLPLLMGFQLILEAIILEIQESPK